MLPVLASLFVTLTGGSQSFSQRVRARLLSLPAEKVISPARRRGPEALGHELHSPVREQDLPMQSVILWRWRLSDFPSFGLSRDFQCLKANGHWCVRVFEELGQE